MIQSKYLSKEDYETANFIFSNQFDISNARKGQRGAINCIIHSVKTKQQTTISLVVPTR